MKFFQNKKITFLVLLIVVILGFSQIKVANAFSLSGIFSIGEITANVISFVAQGVGYIIGFISGVFFSVAGYLIQLALNINFELLKSPVVQTGWQIVLNLTNLGFVLAIIIIAFATIFRVQSYAMKQTLWKLIVAALLVNFSLVIAGAFINVSDIFSNYFLQQGGIKNPLEWSQAFAGMFRAQALLKVGETIAAKGVVDTATGAVNTFGAAALQTIASVFFLALFTMLAAITLLAVAIMLFIRYIFLGILLLLSPIIWLLWIFPGPRHHWERWWQQFLRWTFFAPIMLFFIYLSMAAMKYQPEVVRQFTQNPAATANVKLTFGVEVIGEMAIVIGLVIGGLIAANSLSINFGSTAYGWAQGAGKWLGGVVGRATYERTAGRILGSEWMKKQTEKLSARRGPLRWVGAGLNRLGVRSEKIIKDEYEKLAKGLTPERLNYEILSSRGVKRAVLMSEAAKRKDLDLEKLSQIINNPTEMAKIEQDFKRAGINFKDFTKALGRNVEMIKAATTGDVKALQEATDHFIQSISLKDYAKGQWNDIFKATEDPLIQNIQNALAVSFAKYEHGAYSKIQPHIKAENLENFAKIMRLGIEEAKKQAKAVPDIETSAKLFEYAAKAADRLEKTLNRRALFGEEAWVPPKEETT